MKITLPGLADDPALFLYAFDLDAGVAQVQEMDRKAFQRSIFLDGRISREGREAHRIGLDALLDGYRGAPARERPIGLIFHVAQCGSSLLARALDWPGRSLSLREPYALRQLGVVAGAESSDNAMLERRRFGELLDLSLSMYGKHWEGEASVLIKANVPVNYIANEIMARIPEAPAIVLHFGLEDYLAAVMRSEGHCDWVETVYAELRLDLHPLVRPAIPASTAERAAALWFTQMKTFENILSTHARVRSLEAGAFLSDPRPVVEAAAGHFGIPLSASELDEMIAGDLFHTYSKNPTLDYDPEVRVARHAQSIAKLADKIDEAFGWAARAQASHGLCDALPLPLSGNARPLLARS